MRKIADIKECINKYCENCKQETTHQYQDVDHTIPKGKPDVVIKCDNCNTTQYITEKDWVMNCYFLR